MVTIKISSPREIRRQVNSVRQSFAANNNTSSAARSSRPSKRRVVSYDLVVDFCRAQDPQSNKVMQAEDLAILVAQCPGRLESIALEDVEVQGDFSRVTAALSSPACQNVRNFHSYTCRIRNNTQDLQALGQALATMPNLQSIALGMSNLTQQPVLGAVLTPVLQRPNHCLKKIFVNGFCLNAHQEQEVQQFFAAMEASTTLQRLVCLPMTRKAFGVAHMPALGRVIRHNRSLQCLELYIHSNANLATLAEDFQYNNSLTRFIVDDRSYLDITIGGGGANANNDNDNNQEPTLVQRKSTYANELRAFYTVLQNHNFKLQEFRLDGPQSYLAYMNNNPFFQQPPLQQQQQAVQDELEQWNARIDEHMQGIEFQLTLNRMGRARLLAPGIHGSIMATTDDWMEAIANQDDVSVIFYFLQKNPTLCLPDPTYRHQVAGDHNNNDAAEMQDTTTHTSLFQQHQPQVNNTSGNGNGNGNDAEQEERRQRLERAIQQIIQQELQHRIRPAVESSTSVAVVSPHSSNSNSISNNNLSSSPVHPRTLHQEQETTNNSSAASSRKRSRNVFEQEEEEEADISNNTVTDDGTTTTSTTASPQIVTSVTSAKSMGDIVRNVAVYAATFAAGYVARGFAQQHS